MNNNNNNNNKNTNSTNFEQQFVLQKWPRMGKRAITKGINIVLGISS